jgi:hypothetical protein
VQRGSALTGLPNEQGIPLPTTHEGLCKYASTTDSNYFVLSQQLVDIAATSIQRAREKFKTYNDLSNIKRM